MVKRSMKKLFAALTMLAVAPMFAESVASTSHNYFQPRAFSANLAREMLMQSTRQTTSEGWYGEFAAAGAYQQSWKSAGTNDDVDAEYGLGSFPFWSGTNVMTYGNNGQATQADDIYNMDAYQFGLGNVTTAGSITLNPIVYQAGGDLLFIIGSSAQESCFFAKVKAPVGVYNINPQLTEEIGTPAPYATANLTSETVAIHTTTTNSYQPASTMAQAFAGNLPDGQLAQGDFRPMQYGLIAGQQSTGAKFGDMELTAGYRFISESDNVFSVGVRASAPTGGRVDGKYMLEPVFGRGGNWGLGGYLDGHVTVWNGSNDNCFMIKFMANAMHLFAGKTVRSYDLTANGEGSKYLLVANYEGGVYQWEIANLINYSTLESTSTYGVEADAALAFTYMGRGWSVDLGYNFWGRSSEKLTITGDFANESYAVLGQQAVGEAVGYASTATSPYTASYALYGATNDCQPTATMANTSTTAAPVESALTAANRISLADLNVAGAQQATALTSKVFTKVTYEFCDSDNKPHVGVMGEFEFSTSQNNALPQWGVSLIGGLSF